MSSADKAGIHISSDISPDLPFIKGDRTKLMQMMLNVLKNSVESIDKSAVEKIISISARLCNGYSLLIFQVKDNGHGFDSNKWRTDFQTGIYNKIFSFWVLDYITVRLLQKAMTPILILRVKGREKAPLQRLLLKFVRVKTCHFSFSFCLSENNRFS